MLVCMHYFPFVLNISAFITYYFKSLFLTSSSHGFKVKPYALGSRKRERLRFNEKTLI